MDDNKLLELAAKAAGYELEYRSGSDAFYYDDEETGREQWCPLDDDGQAFRLAVKLGVLESPKIIWAQFGENPHAATRRAIVEVAASAYVQLTQGGAA